MSIAISSSVTKSDKVTLFTSKDDFDTWLAGLSVPDATTSTRGVVLQASDPATFRVVQSQITKQKLTRFWLFSELQE